MTAEDSLPYIPEKKRVLYREYLCTGPWCVSILVTTRLHEAVPEIRNLTPRYSIQASRSHIAAATDEKTGSGMPSFSDWARPTKTYHTTTYDRIAKRHGFDGAGKTALVVGGSSGIGLSICKAFASTGVARIAIISRSQGLQETAKAEIEAVNPSVQVLLYQASVTDGERLKQILQELRSIDVMVLCASVVHRRAPATEVSTKDVQDSFDSNVVASFNLVRAYLALDTPPPAGGSKIVLNISSAAAQVQGTLRVGYGSSKAAATQVMQHFAFEHSASPTTSGNFKIISFHPGSFYTPTVAAFYSEDHFDWDDIRLPAHFALWLAGPESNFLNGRYVWAHWDVDELIALKERVMNDQNYLTIGLIM